MDEDRATKNLKSVGKVIGGTIALVAALGVVSLFGFLIYRGIFYDWTDNYHVAYVWDSRGGKLDVKDHTGYIRVHPLWQDVHVVDTRPMQVCINANQRVLNCKLVKFNRQGLELFLSWHGRGDYDNISPGGNLNEILKSYAYDGLGRAYPFLTIVTELKPSGEEQK